jgi:undecaprenyl diphosphate synthase
MEKQKVPPQIAIIMDGNRRWAKEHGLPTVEGHRKGVKAIEPIVRRASEIGVKGLVFWAFSTENWKRGEAEVSGIMYVFRGSLADEEIIDRMLENDVQIRTIGDTSRFAPDIQQGIKKLTDLSSRNKGIIVNFALNYMGDDEIMRGVNKAIAGGKMLETPDELIEYLDMKEKIDLIVRTSGEQRTSGFLIFQAAQAEHYYTSVLWPDFTPAEFDKAIMEYQRRDRRFGK